MSRTTSWLAACVLLTFLSSSCSRAEKRQAATPDASANASPSAVQTDGPPADVVQATAVQVDLTAGGKAEAAVKLVIAQGYHINGNPSSKFQIPTTLDVDTSNGISAGKAMYPKAISKVFSFSPDPIVVYEGEVVIKQPLEAKADVAKGTRSLSARVRVQPCDDLVCYPPRTLPVTIPVNVK